MFYLAEYDSVVGKITIASTKTHVVGLWIEGQKYFLQSMHESGERCEDIPGLQQTKVWLDRYFAGEKPLISELPLAPIGSEFRQEVWKILCKIPYGEVITYGEIAKQMAKRLGKTSMSAQAIGGAVGHNPVSIIIPCHRVVGTNGSLTGYAGGIEKKIALLEHEKVDMAKLFVPKKGTAL